jgi:hypothetical protein
MQLEGEGTTPRDDQGKDEADRRQSEKALNEPAEQDAQAGPSDQGNDSADSGREQLHPVLMRLHLFHYALSSGNLLSDLPTEFLGCDQHRQHPHQEDER